MAQESSVAALLRLRKLQAVQKHYSEFLPFLEAVMELLGFRCSEIQQDIAQFIAYGPHYLMAQAQRGQAKTTIVAAYAVWDLIHNPSHRVLVVSGGGPQAKDIAILVIRIVQSMDCLECMRPDTQAGDRASVEGFDIHHSLKGVDKSASIASIGIEGTMQGRRADLLIADDVEVTKNSQTPAQRAKLLHLTLDFTSVCSTGRIIWLGTPQTEESVYRTLPGRGVTVRIWPGRYPTPAQMESYGDQLAPLLQRRIAADPSLQTGGGALGDQGQAIEKAGTGWLDEENLQMKELDQGASWFQLQHMLNTKLSDELRYPIKPDRIILLDINPKQAPLIVVRSPDLKDVSRHTAHTFDFCLRHASSISSEVAPLVGVRAYVDPAAGGANGDETAYAVTGFLNSTVYLLDWGGLPGGYTDELMRLLAQRLARWEPQSVTIEKNMGFGAFRQVFQPIMQAAHSCGLIDDMVSGQKEKRIIQTLEPVIGRGSLVITPQAVEQDRQDCARYEPKNRQNYLGMYQLAKLTAARNALVHDDRADALEGSVRCWQESLTIDEKVQKERAAQEAYRLLTEDPLGHHRYDPPAQRGSMLTRRLRR